MTMNCCRNTISDRRASAMWLCGILAVLVAGCIAPDVPVERADLLSVPEGSFAGPDAYCDFTNGSYLRIVIQNQGQEDAPATSTRVSFSPGGTTTIPTPPVRAGQRVILSPVKIPSACFDPDCDFKITMDAWGQAIEYNEENNIADGRCIR